MRLIYHLVPARSWSAGDRQPYRAASLATEGFIHCSNRDQVARVANLFYESEADLCVLEVDASRLDCLLRDEAAPDGELFPHVYGPIDRPAIVSVTTLKRDQQGRWTFP